MEIECFACGVKTREGLKLLEQTLCPACERKILQSKAGKLDYDHWVDVCRRFWEKAGINLQENEEEG